MKNMPTRLGLMHNLFNQTIQLIDNSKRVSEDQKRQAKGVLEYFKEHAPAVLPLVADIIKRTLGL
jgi:hypothetical protein